MPNINMMCDRCPEGEHAEWDEELGCYLCAKCRTAEGVQNAVAHEMQRDDDQMCKCGFQHCLWPTCGTLGRNI
jgi:hypothetical protein